MKRPVQRILSVRMESTTLERVRALAVTERRSMGQVIRFAVDAWLEAKSKS
jgi:hypothetical protein